MLSKRLAIAVMLIKGYDYLTIRNILKVSPATIGTVSLWLKYSGKSYRLMVESQIKKENLENILEKIDSAIELVKPEKTFSKVSAKGFPKGKYKQPF